MARNLGAFLPSGCPLRLDGGVRNGLERISLRERPSRPPDALHARTHETHVRIECGERERGNSNRLGAMVGEAEPTEVAVGVSAPDRALTLGDPLLCATMPAAQKGISPRPVAWSNRALSIDVTTAS